MDGQRTEKSNPGELLIRKRKTGPDILRALSCIAVILIHYPFPDPLGPVIKAMCRFAVPCFLLTSGYFYEKQPADLRAEYAVRHLRATLHLLLVAAFFYSVYTFCSCWITQPGWNWQAYAAEHITWARILKLLLTDDPFVYAHLWYLPALCKCYLFVLLTDGRPPRNTSTSCLFPGMAAFGLMGFTLLTELKSPFLPTVKNYISIGDSGEVFVLSNLFLFRALPFFLMGVLSARAEKGLRRSLLFPSALVLCGTVASAFECSRGTWQFYLGTYFQATGLFMIALRIPEKGKRLAAFGQSCGTWIYLTHIAIGQCCSMFIGHVLHLWGTPWSSWGLPVAALLCSILCASIHARAVMLIKRMRNLHQYRE